LRLYPSELGVANAQSSLKTGETHECAALKALLSKLDQLVEGLAVALLL
jgi:hypothetical protein